MKATKLFLVTLAAITLGACQNDINELSQPVTAKISANIGNVALSTRAYNATWETNDKIGVYATNNDKIYKSFANSVFTNAENPEQLLGKDGEQHFFNLFSGNTIEYPSDGSNVIFYAYYPYTDSEDIIKQDNGSYFYYVNDWSNQDRIPATTKSNPLDLMVADKEIQSSKEPDVRLTFRHKFAKLILNISANVEGTQLKEGDLEGMEVSTIGMNYPTKCNIMTGDVTSTVNKTGTFKFKTNAEGTVAEAIICPDVFPNEDSKIVFTLKQKSGETAPKKFTWTPKMPSNATTTFASGNSYIWNVRLNGNSVEAELRATIIDWKTNEFYSDKPEDIYQDKQ